MDQSPSNLEAPKEPAIRRYKLVWRTLLISNFALGAYIFAKAREKNRSTETAKVAETKVEESKPPPARPSEPPEPVLESEAVESPSLVPPTVKMREPLPEDEQRQVLKWILEEKRKIKPKDHAEKRRIDEDKAVLKQLLRAESIPRF